MEKIIKRFADFVIQHRLLVLCIIGGITLAFGWQCRKLTISTNFNELLPQDHYRAFAYMDINGIGLSISTLPVSASGIGMGVDYGIYLLARCEEEKHKDPRISMETALMRTIMSSSKSIIYIAGTLVLGLLVWALSPMKFQAQMGIMLAVILFFNCLGSVFFVPVLILMFKPKFLTRKAAPVAAPASIGLLVSSLPSPDMPPVTGKETPMRFFSRLPERTGRACSC